MWNVTKLRTLSNSIFLASTKNVQSLTILAALAAGAYQAPSNCDHAQAWQLGFQDPATPIMEGIVDLHHDIMFFLVIICVFVLYLLFRVVFFYRAENGKDNYFKLVHGKVIEIVWTITPSFVLAAIAVPSFALVYSMDEVIDPAITLKAIGHQWYWSYEYSDYLRASGDNDLESIAFDSYMIPEDELEEGGLRLLEVDNPIYLPTQTHIRLIVTSEDVLHCWTIPSFGVKIDACPGRLHQASLFIKREGSFYGQCSEICGVNHGFMPICVKAVSLNDYVAWVSSQLAELA